MSFFTPVRKIVDLGGGNTVTLKRVTFGERQEAASKSARMGVGTTVLDMPRYKLEMLKVAVVAWDGPDFEGRPATPENVANLPASVADKLAEETDALAELSEEEKN